MAIPIQFSKARAQELIDCIANGAPIRSSDERGWTLADFLHVRGAFYLAAMSFGLAGRANDAQEHKEARWQAVKADVEHADRWFAERTKDILEKTYDERFEVVHKAILSIREDGEPEVTPNSGFRGPV